MNTKDYINLSSFTDASYTSSCCFLVAWLNMLQNFSQENLTKVDSNKSFIASLLATSVSKQFKEKTQSITVLSRGLLFFLSRQGIYNTRPRVLVLAPSLTSSPSTLPGWSFDYFRKKLCGLKCVFWQYVSLYISLFLYHIYIQVYIHIPYISISGKIMGYVCRNKVRNRSLAKLIKNQHYIHEIQEINHL